MKGAIRILVTPLNLAWCLIPRTLLLAPIIQMMRRENLNMRRTLGKMLRRPLWLPFLSCAFRYLALIEYSGYIYQCFTCHLDSELGGHIIYFIGVFRCLPQAAVKSTVPNLPDGTNYHPDQKLLDLALQLKKAKEHQMQASLKPLVCRWVPTVYYIYSLFFNNIYIYNTLKVTTMIVMLI